MATVTLNISDEVKNRAEQRAAEAGLSDLSEYLSQLLLIDAAGPEELQIDSDDDLERIVLERAKGPWVDMDAADFQQMREKLIRMLAEQKKNK